MKNKTFFQSVRCAINGFIYALGTEKNYKYYLGISLFFLILNLYFGVELSCHLCHVVTTMGVFSAECLNTAIEHFIDMIDKEIKPEIKLIKDIAASSVLAWGIAFFMCEFLMLGSCIL